MSASSQKKLLMVSAFKNKKLDSFRTFEMDLRFPMEKDLRVEVYDWDLIGTDDEIGCTVIDLETRYYSKFRAWCGLPESYFK